MPYYHFRKFLNQIPTLRNSIVLPQMCRSFVTREFFQFFSIFFKQYPADFHWQNQYLLHQDGHHIKNRRLVVYNGATPLFSLKYTILVRKLTFYWKILHLTTINSSIFFDTRSSYCLNTPILLAIAPVLWSFNHLKIE